MLPENFYQLLQSRKRKINENELPMFWKIFCEYVFFSLWEKHSKNYVFWLKVHMTFLWTQRILKLIDFPIDSVHMKNIYNIKLTYLCILSQVLSQNRENYRKKVCEKLLSVISAQLNRETRKNEKIFIKKLC